jgi:hypothetical protein
LPTVLCQLSQPTAISSPGGGRSQRQPGPPAQARILEENELNPFKTNGAEAGVPSNSSWASTWGPWANLWPNAWNGGVTSARCGSAATLPVPDDGDEFKHDTTGVTDTTWPLNFKLGVDRTGSDENAAEADTDKKAATEDQATDSSGSANAEAPCFSVDAIHDLDADPSVIGPSESQSYGTPELHDDYGVFAADRADATAAEISADAAPHVAEDLVRPRLEGNAAGGIAVTGEVRPRRCCFYWKSGRPVEQTASNGRSVPQAPKPQSPAEAATRPDDDHVQKDEVETL